MIIIDRRQITMNRGWWKRDDDGDDGDGDSDGDNDIC